MRRTKKTTCLRSIFCAMVTSRASAAPGVHGIRCCCKSVSVRANKTSKTQVPPKARSGCWEPQSVTLSKSPAGAFAAPPAAVPCCSSPLSHRKRKRLLHRLSPLCNSLLYISLSSVVFCRVRPIRGRTLFFYYDSSFSTRNIRYPTPTWVWIRCGASGFRSNFLRRDAM